ncbi:MAG: C13 family peptidase [Dokdonella sp.]
MNLIASTLLDGLRAVFLRRPCGTAITASAGVFMAMIALYLAVTLGIALIDTPQPWQLDPAGVLTILADSLLTLVAAWLLAIMARRRDIVWGTASILLAATIVIAIILHWPLAHAARALLAHDHALLAIVLAFVARAWWFLVLLAIAHWLSPRQLLRVLGAALLAYAVSAAAWWWLPESPLLLNAASTSDEIAPLTDSADPDAQDDAKSQTDADDDTEPTPSFDAEAVMYDQPALLDAALAKIAPQTPGKVDLYVVAFAGDAGEDVFRNEAEYAEQLFGQRFDAAGHVLVLENNAATVTTRPLASWTNLHRTLDAIAKKMDPAEDILLLYLSSHGSENHQLLVDLDPLPLNQIEPDDLVDALKTSPRIRWKVIVVNACYSGGFVDALRDDSTMLMTSARADRTSFGCGADSDITYFGRAFLVEALNKTTSLRDAFELAKKSVFEWENADKEEEHSEPQLATSPSIEAKLAAWQKHLPTQPAVPFEPAAAAATAH